MKTLKTLSTAVLAAAALAAAAMPAHAQAATPAAAAAKAVQYEGRITAVDRTARTFRIRDAERGTISVRVTSRTRFERVAGFSALRVGMRNVETTVRRSGGRWVATLVERSGGGGRHGGNDDNGGGRHGGNDDNGGDDNGGGRGGDDD
jgi:hypothetical protein